MMDDECGCGGGASMCGISAQLEADREIVAQAVEREIGVALSAIAQIARSQEA